MMPWVGRRVLLLVIGSTLLLAVGCAGTADRFDSGDATGAAKSQETFPSPEAAAQGLLDALAAGDGDAQRLVLGSELDRLGSGDPVADALEKKEFVAAANEARGIEFADDETAYMTVGSDAWRLPIPIVRTDGGWRFDTAEGVEEYLDLRIGRNELHTIATMRTYVDAQYEYASQDRTGEGARQFASRFVSSDGRRDGLFWPAAAGEPESPLGPLAARAVEEGYFARKPTAPVPYHGYLYRILTGQGEYAPGGAMSYVADGRMTRGFALLAFPETYGNSGVMTFIVNQRGIVYQKDLGPDTRRLVDRIIAYDPAPGWEAVTDPYF